MSSEMKWALFIFWRYRKYRHIKPILTAGNQSMTSRVPSLHGQNMHRKHRRCFQHLGCGRNVRGIAHAWPASLKFIGPRRISSVLSLLAWLCAANRGKLSSRRGRGARRASVFKQVFAIAPARGRGNLPSRVAQVGRPAGPINEISCASSSTLPTSK